LRFRLLAYSLT
jgi:hypothetical protein